MASAIPLDAVRTTGQHLAAFGPQCELVNKSQLVAAARSMIGRGIDMSFPAFVGWLHSEKYEFGGFGDDSLRLDKRVAYLRYDVHPQDLLGAYVLADLSEQLSVVGSFQITWRFSRAHEIAEPYYLKLREFDRQFVQFGLHAAPVATWYLNHALGGNEQAAESLEGESFTAWLLELQAAFQRDGHDSPELRRIREGADDTLSQLAASFRAAVGDCHSVSGHGNFLTGAYVKVRAKRPEVAGLQAYFYPGDYLHKWGVTRFGFHHEAAATGSDSVPFARMMWEGKPEADRRRDFRGRVASGAGFVALFHPATWTCARNATFFLTEEAAETARNQIEPVEASVVQQQPAIETQKLQPGNPAR